MKCPSCGSAVPAGETICMECGTELVLAVAESASDAPATPTDVSPAPAPAPAAAATVSCPDCGERVRADANGLCPVCGHDFGDVVELDEDAFFEAPPSLEAAMEAERERLRALGEHAARAAGSLTADAAPRTDQASSELHAPSREIPLPGDRHRERYRTGAPTAVEQFRLEVEGGQTVFFDGRMVSEVRLDVDQISVGRRDPASGHYPDIDLGHFRNIDPHISRRHARFIRQQGRWFIEDLCANDATFLNDTSHALNAEALPLSAGDRVLISESVVLRFVEGPPGA